MKPTSIFTISILSLLLVLNASILVHGQNATINEKTDYIILYDEAHAQYFNHTLLQTALSSLNDTIEGKTFYLKLNTEAFNETSVYGADLILITNPGYDENHNIKSFSNEESTALGQYLKDGGSIAVFGNPWSLNPNITGRTKILNTFIQKIPLIGVTIAFTEPSGTPAGNETDVIVSNYSNDGDSSHIILTPPYYNTTDPVYSQINNVNSLLLYTQSIKADPDNTLEKVYIRGQAPNGSYSLALKSISEDEGVKYQVVKDTTSHAPVWFAAKDLGNNSRTALLGSTIMFSDLPLNSNTSETWVNQRDNLQFFQNLILWLLGLTPLAEPEPPITGPFYNLVLIDIAIAFGIATILSVIGWVYYTKIRPTRIAQKSSSKATDVLEQKEPKEKTRSSKKQKKKKKRQ